METQETQSGQQLESNPEMYAGTIIEKTGDKAIDLERAIKALRIHNAVEQEQ